jgi:hypothetical protein
VPGVVGSAKATAGLIIADFPAIAMDRAGSAKESQA